MVKLNSELKPGNGNELLLEKTASGSMRSFGTIAFEKKTTSKQDCIRKNVHPNKTLFLVKVHKKSS
jgi:hypothetical protein